LLKWNRGGQQRAIVAMISQQEQSEAEIGDTQEIRSCLIWQESRDQQIAIVPREVGVSI
jgi:hypothetical protein